MKYDPSVKTLKINNKTHNKTHKTHKTHNTHKTHKKSITSKILNFFK